jgi:hypothetical protein
MRNLERTTLQNQLDRLKKKTATIQQDHDPIPTMLERLQAATDAENLARQTAEDDTKTMICFSGELCINLGRRTVDRVQRLYCSAESRAKFYACRMGADIVAA